MIVCWKMVLIPSRDLLGFSPDIVLLSSTLTFRFNPFQGFIRVFTHDKRQDETHFCCFNPFQGFIRVFTFSYPCKIK